MMTRPSLTPRTIAVEIFGAVLQRSQPLDLVLAAHAGLRGLDARDRAFVRNLVTTALRRRGQIGTLIDHCLDRPLPARAAEVRHILHLGVCQMFFMDVATHAAVSTAVDLTRSRGHTAHAKLVNAILRRLDREGTGLVADQDAARLNTPAWLWSAWSATYGEATCRRMAEMHLREAPLDISVQHDREAWAKQLDAAILPNGTLRTRAGGAVAALPGYGDGAWWVQDAAARSVGRLLGDVRGKTVIDLCAAPGGKTAYLASQQAHVIAVDRSKNRLARLHDNLARLRLAAQVVEADGATWRPDEPADAVLVDAPCSATGTMRRHPDVAWNKSADDVAALAASQSRLLRAASEMVKPGGTLVFATCSLQPEEGEARIHEFLAAHDGFQLDRLTSADVDGLGELITAAGMFRSRPDCLAGDGGMDGFFAARLKRR